MLFSYYVNNCEGNIQRILIDRKIGYLGRAVRGGGEDAFEQLVGAGDHESEKLVAQRVVVAVDKSGGE